MKKFKITLPIVALALAIATSAFTTTLDGKQWHFNSTDIDDARVPSSYQESTGMETCGGSTLPCIIEVPDLPNSTDQEDLEAYLNSFSSDQAVVNAAVTRKN